MRFCRSLRFSARSVLFSRSVRSHIQIFTHKYTSTHTRFFTACVVRAIFGVLDSCVRLLQSSPNEATKSPLSDVLTMKLQLQAVHAQKPHVGLKCLTPRTKMSLCRIDPHHRPAVLHRKQKCDCLQHFRPNIMLYLSSTVPQQKSSQTCLQQSHTAR